MDFQISGKTALVFGAAGGGAGGIGRTRSPMKIVRKRHRFFSG